MAVHLLSVAGLQPFTEIWSSGISRLLGWTLSLPYFLAWFFVLYQGGRQLLDALPRMPRAGAAQVCALARPRTRLAKTLSLQSSGFPDLHEALSIELAVGAPPLKSVPSGTVMRCTKP